MSKQRNWAIGSDSNGYGLGLDYGPYLISFRNSCLELFSILTSRLKLRNHSQFGTRTETDMIRNGSGS